ncbi:hypothetical protein TRIP_B40239 [uncultured Desulfatiglans sp.]|nr:hypothetical protein TRIP_B40239 [uncultured Desulfatiglans sp.]
MYRTETLAQAEVKNSSSMPGDAKEGGTRGYRLASDASMHLFQCTARRKQVNGLMWKALSVLSGRFVRTLRTWYYAPGSENVGEGFGKIQGFGRLFRAGACTRLALCRKPEGLGP